MYLRNGILSMHTINFPGSNQYEYLFTQIWVSISHTEIPKTFDSISVKFSGLKENINHIPFDIKMIKQIMSILFLSIKLI